ncbi:MAG: DNA repair protein RecN [Deltaproteobacteria bacterium]|nr:DNA repair protein RecN [Deltaproteobacteria bacterium]
MLLNLKVRDFAIIDEVEFELQPGFTVLTGETGAGKSILVSALTLALGGRANNDVIRSGAETAEVEALFDISLQAVIRARLEQRELLGDDPSTLVVRRVIGPKGRAKVVINGCLSTIAMLAEIVRGLVDISGQHEQQSLLISENHVEILDAFGGLDPLKAKFREAYDGLARLARERAMLQGTADEMLKRADYLRFQAEEIERVAPSPGEEDGLADERQRLAHADRLKRGAAAAEALLYGEDGSAFDKLGKAALELEGLARIDTSLSPVAASLESARREIQEASRELQRYLGRVEADPARLEWVDDRLNELRRLGRKHGGSVAELLRRLEAIKAELSTLDNKDARLLALEAEVAAAEARALEAAEELRAARIQAAAKLDRAVVAEVADMNLEGARFVTEVSKRAAIGAGPAVGSAELTTSGLDQVEFMWSANKGEPPRALARIVSGGELSRLMLAVKRVLANRDLVSLYVFDEVDAGLGGRAADAIGRKIETVAKDHQAIAITHLAPIAARAHHHLCVRKETRGKRTFSAVVPVAGAARAEELARMIDGAHITEATREAARQMLDRAP